MILFKKIRYKNLLSSGNIFTEIDFIKNKNTLIQGVNGAGKTTVIDALFYVLYGKPLRPINKPQLVNSITNKNMLVEIEFEVSNKSYLVRRGMKPNVFEIFCNGKMINQDSQTKDYQDMLETQILKINYKSFSQIIVLSMANYTPFMKLPAAARRNVIEDLLDIQIFSVMNTLLKEKVSQNKESTQEVEYNIKLITNKIELHKKHIAELNQNNNELIEARKKQIEDHNEQIRQFTIEIETLQKEIDSHRGSLQETDTVSDKIKEASELLRKAEVYKKKLLSQIQFYTDSDMCPTCDQPFSETFKRTKLSEKDKGLQKILDNIPKIMDKLTSLDGQMQDRNKVSAQISKLQETINKNNTEINISKVFISSLQKEILSLEKKVKEVKEDNSVMIQYRTEYKNSEKRKKELIESREVLLLASQLLKDGGIKTRIIQQYIPVMNKLINAYLAKMDFFIQFELDETFKETIKSRFRDEFSYESFSQGEKLRIDLSLLFAWRAIAKMRNSASTNLLFFDEVLDSSLDNQGIEEFLKIIKTLSEDTNLFIISHRSEHLIDKFDHVIRFEKRHNFSRIAQ